MRGENARLPGHINTQTYTSAFSVVFRISQFNSWLYTAGMKRTCIKLRLKRSFPSHFQRAGEERKNTHLPFFSYLYLSPLLRTAPDKKLISLSWWEKTKKGRSCQRKRPFISMASLSLCVVSLLLLFYASAALCFFSFLFSRKAKSEGVEMLSCS